MRFPTFLIMLAFAAGAIASAPPFYKPSVPTPRQTALAGWSQVGAMQRANPADCPEL